MGILAKIIKGGPESICNLARYLSALSTKPDKTGSYPLFAHIEPTVKCNLNCELCVNKTIVRKKYTLSYDDFKFIVDQFKYLVKITLTGVGEPLLNPDICKMVSYAYSKGILVSTATNATLLDRGLSSGLISAGISGVDFSIDGCTKETYEAIRVGARFSDVLDNIKAFIGHKQKCGHSVETGVNFLLQERNAGELPSMPEFVAGLEIKTLKVLLPHDWAGTLRDTKSGEKFSFKKIEPVLIKAKKEALKNKLKFHCIFPCGSPGQRCVWPWRSCYITCDGYVTPCCAAVDPRRFNYGNIFESDITAIWNCAAIREFRKKLKKAGSLSYIG